jgi:hypothetical protein
MSIEQPTDKVELAKQSAKKCAIEFLQKAGAIVPPADYTKVNETLGRVAEAITENDNVKFQNSLKTFTQLMSLAPFATNQELFSLGNDSVVSLFREYWNLKHPQ